MVSTCLDCMMWSTSPNERSSRHALISPRDAIYSQGATPRLIASENYVIKEFFAILILTHTKHLVRLTELFMDIRFHPSQLPSRRT